eukprot:TRINITY_DN4053_c0_g1_i2.p1 TRINITY_DN4053_c0_g1~~TRINITY_DN4053_c0_g1_i2.p1  ORF type:complete len:503 (+),score=66.84 TRINITY_DN4053_c0_g1_i2:216-1724(+)
MLDNVQYGHEQATRIAVSGIPWETSDAQFNQHFTQFGEVEYAEIVRDRQGRSKGFGFVSFSDPNTVRIVLSTQHTLDHRRIEVKIDTRDVNKNRIFVARIPDSMTEIGFRCYFEKFGHVQDAYMPRDHTKQGFRGIGFVTYNDSETVDRVIRRKHIINGEEVKVDRAIIKRDILESSAGQLAQANEQAMQQLQQGLLAMNIHGGSQTSGLGVGGVGFLSQQPQPVLTMPTGQTTSYSEESFSPTSTRSGGFIDSQHLGQQHFARQQLAHQIHAQAARFNPYAVPPSGLGSPIPSSQSDFLPQQQEVGVITQQGIGLPDMFINEQQQVIENPGPASASAGPRIFVGKLSKDTTEQDVREYFQTFGYVLDVYMPKKKDNKKEHRGFGFITFETEASVKRAVSHGMHRIRGANIAIDVAVPRKEDSVRPLSPTSPTGVASPQPVIGPTPIDQLPVDLAHIIGAQSPDSGIVGLQFQESALQHQGVMQEYPSSAQGHPSQYQGYDH